MNLSILLLKSVISVIMALMAIFNTGDDHSAYSKYHKSGVRRLCWAHLIRKLKGLKDGRANPDAYLFARHMLKEAGTIFSYWHAFKEAGCTREELWQASALIRGRMKSSCLRSTGLQK